MDITSFWNRVKTLCRENRISQKNLSKKLGYDERTVEVRIARGSYPLVEDVEKMCDIFNVPFSYLIEGKENVAESKNKFVVPVLNQKLSAGKGRMLQDDTIIGYLAVPESMRMYGNRIAALYVDGDSMEPTLRRGDMVVCDSCGYDGEGIYALQKDGDAFIKRVYKDSGKYVIKSDNPHYPTVEEPVESDNIAIVGRVHYIIKRCD